MSKVEILSLSIPKRFEETFNRFEKIVESDKDFQEALSQGNPRYNKKNKINTLRSVKVRFAVRFYLLMRERELLEKKEKELELKK